MRHLIHSNMSRTWFLALLLFILTSVTGNNIVMILVDDLDLILDGMTPLTKTQNLIGKKGATYENCFVATPVCCPNRATILTGKYQHNHMTFNNTISGGCSSSEWQTTYEKETFAVHLKNRGYNTFYAGKYLNQYGTAAAGGVGHKPSGWDWWAGLVGNSRYYNYKMSINGTEKKYGDHPDAYLTDVISNMASDFLNNPGNLLTPFLMVLSSPAPHAPFTPAARHNDVYRGKTAKKTPNFNMQTQITDKHWLVRTGHAPMSNKTLKMIDDIYRRRWETLLAVDELVENVISLLQKANILDKTYVIFTSDNGYHVGQFNMPIDKRQPYETDIRVPLMIRGPGIEPGSIIKAPVSSVDLFSTILEMGGTEKQSDGISMLSKNISNDRTLLIEYRGEHALKLQNSGCEIDDADINVTLCNKELDCTCQDAMNNTYSCIRRFSKKNNNLFCVFEDSQNFLEAYDFNADEFQITNIAYTMKRNKRQRFRKRLTSMKQCKDTNCIRNHDMKAT